MQARAAVALALIGSLLGSGLVANSVSAGVLATSTFDSSTEGWTAIVIDGAGNITPSPVTLAAGAGNPGGALRHDAPSEGSTSYFLAPASIVTALHSAVGGVISWDISTIKHSDDVFFSSSVDINIRAGNNRIRLAVTPPAPTISPTYVRYSLGFGTESGWRFFDGTNTTTATQAQINSVLRLR